MITTNLPLASYINGNVLVGIFQDGTKIRACLEQEPEPEFPECIDMKITNRCFNRCPHCHEDSTPDGERAMSIDHILNVLKGLPHGVEIALGGGDILTYRNLSELAYWLNRMGFIVNATINALSIKNLAHFKEIEKMGFKGIGISFDPSKHFLIKDIAEANSNVVVHLINRIHSPLFAPCYPKRLILGFKAWGRGKDLKWDSLNDWSTQEVEFILNSKGITSFDTMALEQLRIKQIAPPSVWRSCYMGDDGSHTMYYDAVKDTYAINSTSYGRPLKGMTLVEAFRKLQSCR